MSVKKWSVIKITNNIFLPFKEILEKVIRLLRESKLTKSAGILLMAIPLALPVGTVTQVSDVGIETTVSAQSIKLESLTADIVSISGNDISLEIVKKPEPVPEPVKSIAVAPASVVRPGNYLPEPNDAGKRALAQAAAAAYGIDWKVLEAVWQVESGKSWRRNVSSYAGASGPCQFMPGTWRGYAVDGNGDGIKDINYAPDCLFGSARLLAANGANVGDNVRALFAYNHSMSYVNKVLAIANSY